MFSNVSQPIRDGLVKQMVDAGCDRAIANETIDLAVHAVDTAIETVKTICQRGSVPQVLMSAHPLALSLLSAAAKVHSDAATTGARIAAAALGIQTVMISAPGEKSNQMGEPS